jgi:antitoxin (DNA-binding transcriptional repressor) of toxin-antitoxin stability system
MVQVISSTVARRQLLKIFERARLGETFLVTRYGKPAIYITPPKTNHPEETHKVGRSGAGSKFKTALPGAG